VKIGGSTLPPMKRVKEINMAEPYNYHGPWSLCDFREVVGWRSVESALHYTFRSKLVYEIKGQKELFAISPHQASIQLEKIDPDIVVSKPKVDRLFMDTSFRDYLLRVFQFSGLTNWLDLQGGWTLSIFTSTAGGRYFTINIARHEVAYSTLPRNDLCQNNMLFMDSLIVDFDETVRWLMKNDGGICDADYKSALPHSVSVHIPGTFDRMHDFLDLPGVRRAILAYWTEGLLRLRDNGTLSFFARFHNYNAVAAIAKQQMAK